MFQRFSRGQRVYLQEQAREKSVTGLRQEVKIIENRILQVADTIRRKEIRLKLAHKNNPDDVSTKKMLFKEIKGAQKLTERLTHLHDLCANLLDHAEESAMMASTSIVLQEFVSAHESVIKDVSLDELVSQYQDMAAHVDEIRADMGVIGESVGNSAADDMTADSLERELEMFLAESDVSVDVAIDSTERAANMVPPSPQILQQSATQDFPAVPMQNVRPVKAYFTNNVAALESV